MYIRSHLGSNQSAFLTSLMADSDSPPPDSESEDSAPPLVDSESEDSRDTWLAQPRTRTQSQHATEAAETYRDLMRAEYVLHKFHEICIKQNEFAAKDQMIWNKLAEKHQMIKTVEEIPLNEQQYKKCTLHERLLLKIHEYNKHRKKVALAEATIARDEDYQQDVTAEQFKKASEDKLGATQPHRRRPSTRPMSERKTTQRHCNKYRRWAATQCLELESNDSQDSSSVTVSDSDDENVAVTAKADAAEITKAETTNAEAASSAATVQARDSNLHSQLKKHFMDETPIWHEKLTSSSSCELVESKQLPTYYQAFVSKDLRRCEHELYKFYELFDKGNISDEEANTIWQQFSKDKPKAAEVDEIPLNMAKYGKCTWHEQLLLNIHEFNEHRRKVSVAESTIADAEHYEEIEETDHDKSKNAAEEHAKKLDKFWSKTDAQGCFLIERAARIKSKWAEKAEAEAKAKATFAARAKH